MTGGALAMGHYIGFNNPARLINDLYQENRAQHGGAVAGHNGSIAGELRIKRSTFVANKAEEGGAVTSDTHLYINNSTFSKNHAVDAGGAIAMTQPYLAYGISNSTFFANSVDQPQGGSVLFVPALLVSGDIAVFNSIMGENVGDECSTTSINDFVIGEHNLTETNSCDPNNGSASAAFGLGNPFSLGAVFGISLPRDQRGVARVGNCDIGAFEFQ